MSSDSPVSKKRKRKVDALSVIDATSHEEEVLVDEIQANDMQSSSASYRYVWTEEEDRLLTEYVNMNGPKGWKNAARYVGTKSHIQCGQRWHMIKPGQVKGSWKIEEDLKLVSLINEKCDNWRQIAAKMEGRSPKQCRERWLLHLNPEIKKTPFTSDEDSILLRLYSEIGNKWTQISRELPGRSDAACKIRYKAIQYCLSKGKVIASIQHRDRQSKLRKDPSLGDAILSSTSTAND